MRTAALAVLCLVVIPAGVFAFAISQPAPKPEVRADVRWAVLQDIAYMKRKGYVHIACTAEAGGSAITCSADDPRRPNATVFVLGTVDIP